MPQTLTMRAYFLLNSLCSNNRKNTFSVRVDVWLESMIAFRHTASWPCKKVYRNQEQQKRGQERSHKRREHQDWWGRLCSKVWIWRRGYQARWWKFMVQYTLLRDGRGICQHADQLRSHHQTGMVTRGTKCTLIRIFLVLLLVVWVCLWTWEGRLQDCNHCSCFLLLIQVATALLVAGSTSTFWDTFICMHQLVLKRCSKC